MKEENTESERIIEDKHPEETDNDNADENMKDQKQVPEDVNNEAEGIDVAIDTPQATPAPMKINQAINEIRKSVKPPEYCVINNKSLLYLIHDFNVDGIEEICVLGIESENPESAGIEFLSDFSRLFSNQKEVFVFFLAIYSINEGVLRKIAKIELGEQAVYQSITKFSLYKGKSDPVVISINFHTREGSIQKWLIFKAPATKPVSTLLLMDTFTCKALVEDINADGWIDIMLFERGMEDGIGCETFLTWKKWDGRKYVDFKTTNIVRNLNSFLYQIREISFSGDKSRLISFSFDPDKAKQYKNKGMTEQEILFRFLGFSKYFGSEGPAEFTIFDDIQEIIFPEILDNPFYLRDEKGFYTKLSFRIIYSDGVSLIPEVLIYMLKNPFGKQQFVLYPISPNNDDN